MSNAPKVEVENAELIGEHFEKVRTATQYQTQTQRCADPAFKVKI